MKDPRADESSGLLVAYYSDDFTGGTDVLEALHSAGVPNVLFVDPPAPKDLEAFPGLKAIGIAGESRALPTAALESCLRNAFQSLKALGARIVHYKICSTFDSSPEIGSIGRALDVGAEIFGSKCVPIVAGAPALGRYCVFGNLFARSGLDSEPYRLDLHPTMSRHPVTPMAESDLRLHLADQTRRLVALFDVLNFSRSEQRTLARFEHLLQSRPDAVLIDVLLEEHLPRIGEILWTHAERDSPLFVVGSSGVEMALTAAWNAVETHRSDYLPPGVASPLLVVSGSCSPVTDQQIARAIEHGFVEVQMDTSALELPDRKSGALASATRLAHKHLGAGQSVIVHTARGPSDPRIDDFLETLRSNGHTTTSARAEAPRILGTALGEMAFALVKDFALRRLVVTGGDTSRHVARSLGARALEMLAPMAPGSPLCRVHAPNVASHGLEICFKGGQVGARDLLVDALHGRINRRHKEIEL